MKEPVCVHDPVCVQAFNFEEALMSRDVKSPSDFIAGLPVM